MPKKKNNLKTLIIILVVVIVVGIAFKVLSGGGNTGGATTQNVGLVTSSATGSAVTPGIIAEEGISPTTAQSNELVVLLKSVSTLTLSNAVFTNPTFNVLQDISSRVRIEGDPGRVNPFLPIGQDPNVLSLDINTMNGNGIITNTVSPDPNALETFLNGDGTQ
jgi:hypothetical protein